MKRNQEGGVFSSYMVTVVQTTLEHSLDFYLAFAVMVSGTKVIEAL